jgi:hypothetical protein
MYRFAYLVGRWVKAWRLGYRDGFDAKVACASNDQIEEAYWLFDHKKKGRTPMSERDAFKFVVRSLLAGDRASLRR